MTDKPEPNKEYALTGKSGDACIANGSSWKESEVKKKRETCKEQLERMVKNVAEDITKGEDVNLPGTEWPPSKYLEDVYDIEWITRQDHSYKAARLLVAGGGPNIWVNLMTNTVDGYWASDKFSWSFQDNIGLDNYLEAMHESK